MYFYTYLILAAKIMNEKEFLNELANNTTKKSKKVKSKHIILAYKKHIAVALHEGYCFKDIYKLLKEKNIYPYNYPSFMKAINLVYSDAEKSKHTLQTNFLKSNSTNTEEPKSIKSDESNSFEFNPKVTDTENLI